MFILFLFILTISILLEGTVTTLPVVFLCLLCFAIVARDWRIFPLAFGAGILLDLFSLRPVGSTSMFFLLVFFLLLLYQRKYEITSAPFVGAAAFIGSGIFLTIFGYRDMLMQAILSAVLAVMLFKLYSFLPAPRPSPEGRGG